MNRETSLYLDLVRFGAAMTVFLGHVSGQRLTGGLLWQFGPYMSQAVIIFFVLSGFVIAYATDARETSARVYAVSRAARIYSVALPALVVTFLLDAIGRSIHPELYTPAWGYEADGQGWQFLANLFFVNEIWFLHVTPGSDLPYWSLGYEVWYYVIFGLAVFTRRWYWLVPAAMLFVGPKILSMFPLWLIGLACYRLCTRINLGRFIGFALWAGSLLLWIAYEVLAWRYGRLPSVAPAFLRRPEFAQDYLVGLLFAMNLLGFRSASRLLGPLLRPFERPIRWMAGTTFTLYLFHVPIAQFLATLVPWPPHALATRVVIVGGTLCGVFLAAEITERRKDLWRRGFSRILGQRALPAAQ